MLMMVVNGVMSAALVVSGKLLQEVEWPYFRVLAVSNFMICICLATGIFAAQVPLPTVNQAKWLMLRGMFGSATFVLQVSAVRIGSAAGDAAALASINTVVAALLGRVFLGEKLEWMHGLAVMCSISGATLISKPSFLFDSQGHEGSAKWFGYGLAAASGLTQAFVFISARKSNKSSFLLLNLSPAAFCALTFAVVPFLPFVHDYSTSSMIEAPGVAIAFVVVFFVIMLVAQSTNSAGSSWCPAAVSATVNAGSKMVSSYLAQSVFFGKTPELVTMIGAAMMLLAVVIMAAARLPGRRGSSSQIEVDAEPEEEESSHDAFDDDESLASFIASEFVELTPHTKSVRLRRQGARDPEACQIGAALSVVVVAA